MQVSLQKMSTFRAQLIHALVLSSMAALMAGCAAPALVGKMPDPVAPRLVPLPVKDSQGREQLTWDRPLAFGPVPARLQALADQSCLKTRVDLYAVGYHPQAQDVQGKIMPGGGFFCALKPQGDLPDAKPPRLIRIEGELGWDRPAAFGQVPATEQARGKSLCQGFDPKLVPIGYHPMAQDETGQPIRGGGFFCAQP